MNTTPPPFISIIIPSYNSAHTIGRTLDGIRSQITFHKILEIIIVDSSDDSITKEFFDSIKSPLIKIITSGIRVMPAKQRNIGAEAAKGDLFVFIDSDAIPSEDWLFHIEKAYLRGYRVGGGSYLIDPSQINHKMVIAEYYFELGEFIPAGKLRYKKVVPSCNLFCDRELFRQVNGFPLIRASEDSLFCLEVNKISPLCFVPEASVIHIFRENQIGALTNLRMLGKFVIVYRKLFYPKIYNNINFLILLYPLIVFFKFFKVYLRALSFGLYHFSMLNYSFYELVLCIDSWSAGLWDGIFDTSATQQVQPEFGLPKPETIIPTNIE
jgi:glycosyltransferase involved in cell wall biosynthesis